MRTESIQPLNRLAYRRNAFERSVAMASVDGGSREIRLDGKVALVTGGGRGLGRAMARALSAAGAAVAVCARTAGQLEETVALLESHGGRALALPADVTDRQAVESMVAQVEQELGPIDTLVNDAAIGGPTGPFAETDPDAWWEVQQVNVRGSVYCSRAALPGMLRRGHGRIINVSSYTGPAPWPLGSAYAVSKATLIHLSESLAAETREHGVQVFAITPGLVRTEILDGHLHCGESVIEQQIREIVDGGWDIPPDHAAQMVVFLASGRGDALSGRFLGPEDDTEELVQRADEIQHHDLLVLRPRGDTTIWPAPSFQRYLDWRRTRRGGIADSTRAQQG
jgi:NAD(P)-dependent dehydrogenase (short-subunit alcohol dehydrogenase family)